MTVEEEKADHFFKKFKIDFDKWDCDNTIPEDNCAKNRLTLLRTKHLPTHESEIVRDVYAAKCNQYSKNKK